MPIEMPKGLPFSVDTWTPSSKRKRHHFLTHAHRDHCTGIATHFSYPIYSTRLTKCLLLQQFPQLDESLFVDVEVGHPLVVNDPDGRFLVTAFDANHCPGAVMFLFEGDFGSIIHTGDCRLTPDCLHKLPMKYLAKRGKETVASLDYIFLDCTFGKCSVKIPNKSSAIQQVINCIWKHPDAPVVYLACNLLGLEEILVEVSKTFGSKIYVDEKKNAECFQALMLTVPHILTQDALTRFQVFEGFPRLGERADALLKEARANFLPEPLFIRPSAQWYACEEHSEREKRTKLRLREAEKDQFGVWHVCYSMHSSREELEWALQLLQPKRVISTTPSCRAMELDYVKNHLSSTQVTADDPLWKLLNVNTEYCTTTQASILPDVSVNGGGTSPVALPTPTLISADGNHLQSKNLSLGSTELQLNLSPSSIRRPITLFGRARLGLRDSFLPNDQKKTAAIGTDLSLAVINNSGAQNSLFQEANVAELQIEKSKDFTSIQRENLTLQGSTSLHEEEKEAVFNNTDDSGSVANTVKQPSSFQKDTVAEIQFHEMKDDKDTDVEKSFELSRTFNASLKSLYRSMNVPVPRPLPSLTELMGTGKRARLATTRENT